MSLKHEVDSKRREISSDNLSMSIGELLNLYKDRELDIHPEFQRVFRWSAQQKSRLIESLLLGIPLPPIYVAANDEGIWEVVDGVQRLSTIFEFMGELKGPRSESSDEISLKPALALEATKHLPALDGAIFEKVDKTLQLEFKRTRIDVKILEREGSASGKFDLFERLNTYGAVLSPQELRNCILVSINPNFYRELKSLAEDQHFRDCTLLSEMQLSERYDMDLALRFIALRGIDPRTMGDVHDYLRDRMEQLAIDSKFSLRSESKLFKEVFEFIDEAVDGNAFRPWNATLSTFRGAFSLGAYEGLALSLGQHWPSIKKVKQEFDLLRVIKSLWASPEYTKSFSGMRARERMVRVAPAAENVIAAELRRIAARKSPGLAAKSKKSVRAANEKNRQVGAKGTDRGPSHAPKKIVRKSAGKKVPH